MAQSSNPPFLFGVRVSGDSFTDRRAETERLVSNFSFGINTILISPRRMGKTSLVDKVCAIVASNDIKVAQIDAFPCRSEADFINAFSTAVVKATSSKLEEWIQNAKQFLSHLAPKFSFGTDPATDFSLSIDFNLASRSADDILQLPELIATQKNIKIVVCIDEFQQIGEFDNSLSFQKKLRSVWQKQEHVSYCLYGSKHHLMSQMFQDQSYPFYRFGDILYLGKISEDDWVDFICRRFADTGKSISHDLAQRICQVTSRHSSYVQQLCYLLYLRTDISATNDALDAAIDALLDTTEPLFIQQTEDLSAYQMNFLHALTDGISTGFTQQRILSQYNLGTPANITRLRKSLTDKDLITSPAPKILEIADPILALWLKRRFWK